MWPNVLLLEEGNVDSNTYTFGKDLLWDETTLWHTQHLKKSIN